MREMLVKLHDCSGNEMLRTQTYRRRSKSSHWLLELYQLQVLSSVSNDIGRTS